jgi:hypothetical protein
MNVWPSLLPPDDPLLKKFRIEAVAEAMSTEDFEVYILEMKEFINIVIKIAFNNLYLHQHNPEAKLRYEELFKQDINPQDLDFSSKIEKYIN